MSTSNAPPAAEPPGTTWLAASVDKSINETLARSLGSPDRATRRVAFVRGIAHGGDPLEQGVHFDRPAGIGVLGQDPLARRLADFA